MDFYILPADSTSARREFVARLLDKIQKLGKTVCIAVETEAEARELDNLLWAYPPESFLPHCVHSDSSTPPPENVVIAVRPDSAHSGEVLINLRAQPPLCHEQVQRLVEVVVQDEAVLLSTRNNFRFYREQGYQPATHHIRS